MSGVSEKQQICLWDIMYVLIRTHLTLMYPIQGQENHCQLHWRFPCSLCFTPVPKELFCAQLLVQEECSLSVLSRSNNSVIHSCALKLMSVYWMICYWCQTLSMFTEKCLKKGKHKSKASTESHQQKKAVVKPEPEKAPKPAKVKKIPPADFKVSLNR